ncbi:hypothetical protein ACFLYO_07385, partial [Chloroflexota bacterium]
MQQMNAEDLVQERLAQLRLDFARVLRLIMLAVGIGSAVVMFGCWFFVPEYVQLLLFGILFCLIAAAGGIFPWLRQRGQVVIGYWLIVLIIFAASIFVGLLLPETFPAGCMGFIVAIMISQTLLGDRITRWLIGAAFVVFLLVYFGVMLFAADLFPQLNENLALIVGGAFSAGILVAIALLVRQLVLSQN